MLDEFKKQMSGLPDQPEVDHVMIRLLQVKFKCDPVVAELACRKANFRSLEHALDFIYGGDP